MTITVTPEIAGALTEEAQKYGTTPELLALETLRERYAERLRVGSNGHSTEEDVSLNHALADLIAEAEALAPRPLPTRGSPAPPELGSGDLLRDTLSGPSRAGCLGH